MNIDELKQQVESAIALFTLVDERNLSFCQGLLDSLKAIERKHLERRADMAQLEEEVERLTQENQQIGAMLQSLLVTVGAGRHRKLDEIRTRLERHVGRLAGTSGRRPEPSTPDRPDIGQPDPGQPDTGQADRSFSVPDASIDEIVARIGRNAATAAEKAEPDAHAGARQPSA